MFYITALLWILIVTVITVVLTVVILGRMISGTIGLHRSRRSRVVAGVAGGFAESLGISPVWTRLIWLILLFPGGLPGLIPYIICWVMMPVRD
jgi:phage shock protein PspC (stress-responsive transcriptional regulator)